MFLEPKYSQRVPDILPTLAKKGEKPEYVTYGYRTIKNMKQYIEWKDFPLPPE